MSSSRLIIFYFIFGLVSYSYELNGGNNIVRRRIRDAAFKNTAQDLLDTVMTGDDSLARKVKESMRSDEDNIKLISRQILEAAQRMAAAGAENIRNAEEWTTAQRELRRGINIVIDVYRNFIEIHRKLCEDVEKFAQGMISKYENELSALDKLNVPTSSRSGDIDTDSPDYTRFTGRLGHILKYLDLNRQLLPAAYDCPRDLIVHARQYQQRIFYSPPPTYTQQVSFAIPQVLAPQYPVESFNLNCNDVNQYNGNPRCSNAVADASQTYLNNACQCMPQNSK